MELIQKAFQVWHDGMISDNPHLGYAMGDFPIVYANTPSEAKSKASEPNDWEIDGKEPKYTDLKVRRDKSYDKVMFEGDSTHRWQAENIQNSRKRTEERRAAVERFPDGSCFYVQNGYVGNSVLWWGRRSSGYVSEIQKAELYTKQEILDNFVSGREEDIIWEAKHVLDNVRSHVDGQYLSKEYKA